MYISVLQNTNCLVISFQLFLRVLDIQKQGHVQQVGRLKGEGNLLLNVCEGREVGESCTLGCTVGGVRRNKRLMGIGGQRLRLS